MTELLTPAEHDAVAQTAELWKTLCGIVADGPARDGDLRELVFHIHAIQRAVLKQAAARAYPELYRLLGGDPPGPVVDLCPDCGQPIEYAEIRRFCDPEPELISTHRCPTEGA